MPAPLDLSIIIVNWNSAEFVHRCISSICKHATGLACEIIVIDNASFDGCDRMLRESDPEVRYIQSDTNLGFAKANNLAFESSRGNSLLFLNPDTEITGPAIATLYGEFSKLLAAGVVGARLLNGDGTLQASCVQSFPPSSIRYWIANGWEEVAQIGLVGNRTLVPGGCHGRGGGSHLRRLHVDPPGGF